MSFDTIKFSNRLKSLRESKGLSQQAFADKLGVSRSTIGNYEQGLRIPDITSLIAMANILEINIEYMISGNNIAITPDIILNHLHQMDSSSLCSIIKTSTDILKKRICSEKNSVTKINNKEVSYE